MQDYDFNCRDNGTTATITTNNWTTTDWVRNNVQEPNGTVVGGVYATITGEPRQMLDIAIAMIAAGLTCPNHEMISRQLA